MDTATRVQIMKESVSVSHSADTFVKGMNSTIVAPVKVTIVRLADFLTLIWQPVPEKENSEFKTHKQLFKK